MHRKSEYSGNQPKSLKYAMIGFKSHFHGSGSGYVCKNFIHIQYILDSPTLFSESLEMSRVRKKDLYCGIKRTKV